MNNKIMDTVEKYIAKILEKQVSYKRVASLITQQAKLHLHEHEDIPQKVYVPFIFEVEFKPDGETMEVKITVSHCLKDGQKASEWLKRIIAGDLK